MTRDAIARFSAQGARVRAESFGGRVEDGTCEASGNNLQIGSTKFRAPFSKLSTVVELRTHGRTLRCSAVILLRRELGIEIDETTKVKHLSSGDIYEVAQIGVELGASQEKRVLLHRSDS